MADNRRIQYNLDFNANTSKAKTEIQSLQKELNKLTSFEGGLKDLKMDESLYKATAAVKEFQVYLQKATDVDTGKLDLSILSKSLRDSGKDLQYFSEHFKSIGPQGEQAFNSITKSIMNAEVPLKKTNKLIQEMAVSLKNTIKWQISSSAVHSFMGAVQGAYGYVQDLDKSLNNIRIVTGQSTDEMAKFAKQANKAAKELSVSTTTYTDAALIYYQQGLTDEQVKERTNTTVKMANVTGESATNVSSYMTAIWNNFDDGSKSLEYYSDVITALGAATAASSEEIAGGLEKFAAVGETVGLSYEYATAALTTIIDKTRQSEDVVGTALKTIFARIQGLQQGEEQEDGVTLNKYSQALANVGIQIIDTSGELKAMDDILDELGKRWQTLSKAEQVALAQTVGGTRQYTQLIALMDNWGSMQENLTTAYGSTGALEEQAKIYSESWEAAQKRVTAALQTIYDQLLNDKFFIGVTNMLADTIELVSKLIDTVGGLPGVLAATGVAFTFLFKDSIPKMLSNTGAGMRKIFGISDDGGEVKDQAVSIRTAEHGINPTEESAIKNRIDTGVAVQRKTLLENENKLSKESQEIIKSRISLWETYAEKVKEVAVEVDNLTKEESELQVKAKGYLNKGIKKPKHSEQELIDRANSGDYTGLSKREIKQIEIYKQTIQSAAPVTEKLKEKTKELAKEKRFLAEEQNKTTKAIKEGNVELLNNDNLSKVTNAQKIKETTTAAQEGFVKASQALTAFTVGITSGISALKVWNNDNLSWFEKIEQSLPMIITSLGSFITLTMNTAKALELFNKSGERGIAILIGRAVGIEKNILEEEGLTIAKVKGALAEKIKTAAEGKGIIVTKAATAANWLLNASLLKITLVIAAAVFAITALISAWNAFKEATPEGQLKKAREELEKSQKAAQETASAYNDLKSSVDSLKSAQDTLAGLTKGTKEWKEAVLQVNQQVLDLIEKYPELAQYMTSENGVLGITEEGLQAQLDSQYAQAQSMQNLAMSNQRQVVEAENRIKKNKFDDISYSTGKQKEGSGRTSDYNSANSKKITAEEAANIGKLILEKNAYNNKTKEIDFKAIDLENASQEFKDGITKNITQILELSNSFSQLDNQVSILDKNIASNWLNSHQTGIDSKYSNFVSSGMAKVMASNRDNAEKEVTENENEIKKIFAELNHMTVEQVQKNIDNKIYDTDLLRASLVDNMASTASLNDVNKYIETFQGFVDEDLKEVIQNIVASGGDESSYNLLEEVQRKSLLKVIENNEDLQKAFNDNADYFGKGFAESLKKYLSDEEFYKQNKEKVLEEQFKKNVSSAASELKIDEDALQSYVDHLRESNEYFKKNKEAALEAAKANLKFAQGAEKVSKAFSDHEEVLKAADEATWEYHEAIAAVQEAASEMLGIDVSTKYVKDHLDDIKKAAEGSEEALTKLQQTAASDWAENFANSLIGVKLEFEDFEGKVQTFDGTSWASSFTSAVDQVAEKLGALKDFTIDADTEPALQSLIDLTNKALMAGQMTEEQMRSMFASIGYTPEVTYSEEKAADIQRTEGSGTMEIPETGQKYTYTSTGTVTTFIRVPQIADANSDKRVTFTKTGGSNKIKASSAKKSSSKGGSSKKDAKSSKDEIERYHKISEALEDINRELDAVLKAKDRAFGKDKIKLMDKEVAKLKELKSAQEAYLKEIENYYKADKKLIASYGAKFDEKGIIINYEELINKQVEKFNKLRTDKAEEEYNKFKEALKQYEETHDLLEEESEKIIDIQNQIYDAALEKIEYKVDLKVDINSDDLKYLEYLLDNLTDAAYDAAAAIANLGEQTATQLANQEAYIQGINDIFATHGMGQDMASQLLNGGLSINSLADMNFTESEIEAIRNYSDGLLDINKSLKDIRDNIWESVLNSIEALGEEFDEQAEKVDYLVGVLDSYQNIIGLVGQEVLGITDEMMESFSEIAVDNAIDALVISKAKVDDLKAKKDALAMAEANATTEEEKKKLKEQLKEVEKMLRDAENEMLSDWEATLEAANKAFEQSVDLTIKKFGDVMAGAFGDMKILQDEFNKTKEINEMYLDDYKQIYELSKLTRDINKSIDETNNLAAKNKLRDIQKEINSLQEAGVELSQYDLDHLRAKYELRLAEIALEDAQNAKNQVRMTKDSEGNWSYTYTADQDNINSAQQNYEDKLYALQELSSNYIKDLEEQIIDLSVSMMEEIAAIDRAVYASEEEYNAEVQRITDFYQTKMSILNEQMDKAFGNNQELYNKDWKKYSEATGYKISADEKFVTSFNETTLGIKTGFENMEQYQKAFNDAIGAPGLEGTLLGDLNKAYETWRDRVDEAMQAAGTSTDNFKEVVVQTAETIDEESDKAADSMEELKDKSIETFKAILKEAQDFEKKYGPEINKIIADNERLITNLRGIIGLWSKIEEETVKATNAAKDYSNYSGEVTSNGTKNTGDSNKTSNEPSGDKKTYYTYRNVNYPTQQDAKNAADKYLHGIYGEPIDPKTGLTNINWLKNKDKYLKDQEKEYAKIKPITLNTGGYTGAWGSSGRLAMLHEKELVLNKEDTANMLSIVDMVRDITKAIDLKANGFNWGLGNLISAFIPSKESNLNQNVEIKAEFPNVTNRTEIEAAFDNLINRASQYANRK